MVAARGEGEVEAEDGEKEQRRRDVRGSSTSNTEIPALSMAASQRRGSRPEREREAAAGLPRNLSVGSEERMARRRASHSHLPEPFRAQTAPPGGSEPGSV